MVGRLKKRYVYKRVSVLTVKLAKSSQQMEIRSETHCNEEIRIVTVFICDGYSPLAFGRQGWCIAAFSDKER